MKPSTIYSKSGKGVQEASGKTSLLKRADRAVLSAIDGRATLGEVAQKVGKSFDGEFEKLIAQLDKEGFVREVAAAASAASQSRPAVATAKSAAKPSAAKASSSSSGGADDLDFTTIMPAIKPAARPLASAAAPSKAQVSDAAQRAKEQESALYKARQEAEAKAQAERDRIKQEAEAKARVEAEAKARLDAENRLREEAIGRAKAAAEAQVKAARAKAEAEVQAKLDAERRMREEVERKVREEAERALREAEALRQRLEEERKAREEVERKRREEEERRRMEEEERRARAEAERKAREEAERKRREEEERKRREEEEKKRRAEEERRVEEEARRLREEIEAKAREAAELARREAEDRLLREKEEQVRRAKEAEEARMLQARAMEEARMRARQRERDQDEPRGRKSKDETRVAQPTLPAAAPAAQDGGSLDALMADLDSFSQREEEERQAREVADRESREEGKRKSQAEAERRAQEDAERQMREQLEREAREQEERQRRDEEERRAREEAERRAVATREAEESRRLEAEERKRKAQEALLAKAAPLPDIEVSDKDLDMTEVRRDEAAVARDARKAQREREREARQRAKEAKEHAKASAREASAKSPRARRKINWGRPAAVALLTLLAAGLVALHVIPLPMDDYERAASAALGRPVKIGTGRLSLYNGLRLNLSDLSVDGSTTIASARAYPQLRALIEGRQVVDRLELSGVTVPQSAIGAVVGAKLRGEGFGGARIFAKDLRLTGPVQLPVLEGEARIGPDGAMRSVILSGPDGLAATLTPTAAGEVEFDVTAANLTVPFAPELTLSSFAMKGKASRQGMNIASWGGGVLDGAISGTANLRWSGAWQLEGGLTARAINAAAFAPALLSEGKAEGQARFSMSGKDPAKLSNAAYLEGNFSVGKGALGTIDLARVLHTGGRQYGGRTQFTEMTGHATYDHGAVALRNVNITAGALTAAASADIAPSGAIAGRVVADIRTTVQPLRAILVIGGTVKEPQVRN
jgi:actin-related protein